MHGGICRQYRCNIYFFPVEEGRGAVAPTTTNVRRGHGPPLWSLLCLELDTVVTMDHHNRKTLMARRIEARTIRLGRQRDDSFRGIVFEASFVSIHCCVVATCGAKRVVYKSKRKHFCRTIP